MLFSWLLENKLPLKDKVPMTDPFWKISVGDYKHCLLNLCNVRLIVIYVHGRIAQYTDSKNIAI